jgi:8-oxo-dGTP pyrophosphatase MutT (NUDIX family)
VPDWLVESARTFAESVATPVPAKLASTVILLRRGTQEFEVFALRRAASMAFAAGLYAFPGGAVDPRDAAVVPAWAGPAPEEWAARLRQDEATARAIVCAAVREVFEECGVLLAGPNESTVVGDVSGDDWEAARVALIARQLGFAEFLAAQGLILRSDLLAPWARWVTPDFEPRRYDTYFFLARLPEGQVTRDVGGEAIETIWAPPVELAGGGYPMLPPTIVNLRQLADCDSVDAAWQAASGRDAGTPIQPRLDVAERALKLAPE